MKFPLPYYAVIFTSIRTAGDNGYDLVSDRMEELVKNSPGFLGMDFWKGDKNVTICYWDTLENIAIWKTQLEHKDAQQKGYEKWYRYYNVKICKVEKEYTFEKA